jgi:outer membrane murein-binding lipoprotein Lpp
MRRLAIGLLATLALAGCAPKQESEAISKSGNQFLEEEKREAPKVEQATREVEALGAKAHEEREQMEAKGEWQGAGEGAG